MVILPPLAEVALCAKKIKGSRVGPDFFEEECDWCTMWPSDAIMANDY